MMMIEDMDVNQLEKAVPRLPAEEPADFLHWLEDYHAQVWDMGMDQDLEAGRLDGLHAEVEDEYEVGPTQPL